MEKNNLQTTVKELETFLSINYRKTGIRPTLDQALDMMGKKNLLSSPMLSDEPEPNIKLTVDEICERIDAQPIDATAYLENITVKDIGAHMVAEDAIFSAGRDVAVTRQFSYLSIAPTAYDFFTVIVVLKEHCQIYFDDVPLSVNIGGLVIIPPRTPHTIDAPDGAYIASLHMRRTTFDARFGALMTGTDKMSVFFRTALYGANEMNYLHIATDFESNTVLPVLRSLVTECTSDEPFANLCAMSWMNLFLATAFRLYGESSSVLRPRRDETARADFGSILQYIQQNYRTVRLSSLAKTFHYNETYLSRMLQSAMGQSFTDIVRGIKMTRAEEYLHSSNLRIHEISMLVGYDSVDHFSRTFKATYGMSPQAYRRNCAMQRRNGLKESLDIAAGIVDETENNE